MWKLPAYKMLVRLVRLAPWGLAYAFARLAGTLLVLLPNSRRDALRANLAVVYGTDVHDRRVRRSAKQAARHAMLNYVDLMRIGRADAQARARSAPVEGWPFFDEAHAQGKGVILVSAHLGPYDTIVQTLVLLRNVTVLIPMERIEPPKLLAYMQAQRGKLGITLEPIGPDTFHKMAAILREQGVVIVVSDRDIQGSGEPVEFFGRQVAMPAAAVLLALRTGAPLLGAFAHRDRNGVIHGRFTPPLALHTGAPGRPGGRSLRAELAAGLTEMAHLFEREIRRNPDQWVVMQPVFGQRGTPRLTPAGGLAAEPDQAPGRRAWLRPSWHGSARRERAVVSPGGRQEPRS